MCETSGDLRDAIQHLLPHFHTITFSSFIPLPEKNVGQETRSHLYVSTSPSFSPSPRLTPIVALVAIILPVMSDMYMCLCCCSQRHKTKCGGVRHFLWRGMFSLTMPPIIVAFLTFLHQQFWHSKRSSCYEFGFAPVQTEMQKQGSGNPKEAFVFDARRY